MTLLETDIEQDIRKAIVGALGQTRCEMWLGKKARIDVLDTCIRIHALNPFAVVWVKKNYMSVIQNKCRSYLGKNKFIEIVSKECNGFDAQPVSESENHTSDQSQEKLVTQPRFDTGLLVRKQKYNQNLHSISDVLPPLPTAQLTFTVLEDRGEGREVRSGGKGAKGKKKESTPASPSNAMVKKATVESPQAQNEQIIKKGKDKLADITTAPVNRTAMPTPALKRDSANRNVVLVSGVTPDPASGRAKATISQTMTLKNFVRSPSNDLAVHAAILAMEHTGQISPIYIHGPTSVGKTHLLEAIKANMRRNPQAKPVIMMTAEQFTSLYVDGVKPGGAGMPMFRNKFRGIAALLIDDIQFFAGKHGTQIEFLRTIDQLKSQGVQIVLTGDRPLKGLADLLKPEIIARLEAGMPCEIKPADHRTLLAIFKQMAASRNLKLTDDVCEYVVSHLTMHARQLAGAINRLHATVLTSNRPMTRETAEHALDDMIRNNRKPIRLQDIEKAVCETMQLNGQVLQSKSRTKQATQPRMLALWLARKYTRSTLSEIGKYFGNRSHSTVVSAQKKVDQWLQQSPDFGLADSPLSVAEVIQKVERLLHTHG